MLNVIIIEIITCLVLEDTEIPDWLIAFIGLALYEGSLFIALFPIGEWILRLQTHCKKIERAEQMNFIEPIFREVYDKAKMLDPSIPDDIQLYMNEEEEPNAFATGEKQSVSLKE